MVSEKISRDEKTGVSKEVGFARYLILQRPNNESGLNVSSVLKAVRLQSV